MAMLRLSRIFKNYNETGSLNEQINLYGFIGPHVFLTKSGEVGVILEVRGVDYECLDAASIDGFTKRLESALKLFDENYRDQKSDRLPRQQGRHALFPVGLLRVAAPGISSFREARKRPRRVSQESNENPCRSTGAFLFPEADRRS